METYTIKCNCVVCDSDMEFVSDSQKSSDYIGNVCLDCFSAELYEDQSKFGKFLYMLRKEYGWSRKYVAKKIGFGSESSVMNFETGHTIMKPKHISRFCRMTPTKLTVPILYAMFEAGTIKPPCRCVCHYDMNNAVPNIYDDDGQCNLCGHNESDCTITNNGLWFENSTSGIVFDPEVEVED